MTDETPTEAPRERSLLDHFNPGWAALVVSLIALILAATPFVSGGMTGQVRDALVNNPEILREASLRLQQQEAEAVQAAARQAITQNLPALTSDGRDPSMGPGDAQVTVVQFFDYRCPYCKQIADEYMALVAANPDVRFIFKEWPILDRDGEPPASEYAARAALAASLQGRYPQVHQALMARQTIDEAGVEAVLAAAGVDLTRARADIAAAERGQHLTDVMTLARNIGLSGTPTFIVNGEMVTVRSIQDIQAAIDQARGGRSSAAPAPQTGGDSGAAAAAAG